MLHGVRPPTAAVLSALRMRSQSLLIMWLVAPARAQIPQLFQTLDQNADGVLSRSELGVFSQSAIGPNGQPLDVAGQQTHFDTLDLNSDGKISYEEFEQAASTASMASSSNTGLQDAESAAGSILAHFDQDHDGQLNLDELAGFLAASHGLTAEMLDVDGDGFITKDELIYAMRSMAGQSFS